MKQPEEANAKSSRSYGAICYRKLILLHFCSCFHHYVNFLLLFTPVCTLQQEVSVASKLPLQVKDFSKLMSTMALFRGSLLLWSRQIFPWSLLKASLFPALSICTLFCLPLRSSLCVFPTLPVALVVL